jgi:lysophospholipase L1-like esterase
MIYRLATTLLLPVLLPQAFYVSKTALRLPEAQGPRLGCCGDGETLKLLIVGDSAAAGVGVDQQSDALAGQLSDALAAHYQVQWQLLAKSGNTCADVLQMLEVLTPQPFDVVMLSVGVNDVTHFTRSAHWVNKLTAVLALLASKFSVKKVLLCSIPPMQFLQAIPQPLRWWLGQRAERLNTQLAMLAENTTGGIRLSLDQPFESNYLADDGFHPSKIAYRIWAEQAAQAIKSSLQGECDQQ